MEATIILKGTSPLLMHNPRMVDPEFEINRQIKALTAKRKKTDEDHRKIGALEWYGGIYTETTTAGRKKIETVVQPSSKVRKCIVNTGKISKQGKSVERAVVMTALNIPLIYEGPKAIDDLFRDEQFHSRLSVGIGGKRVMRVRPQFNVWELHAPILFVEDAGLNTDELERLVKLAGVAEGIGDGRAIGYGRFEGSVEWR